ncbi:MAG: fructose-specific phosphotransferase system IIC component [Alphaproteobacteria bacterium]|jgi:fructose-specific phosphotransferase system IIC component
MKRKDTPCPTPGLLLMNIFQKRTAGYIIAILIGSAISNHMGNTLQLKATEEQTEAIKEQTEVLKTIATK